MTHDPRLEARYERLLALFPAAHRQEYGDEMIGVLLTGAKPQQRYPGLRETADLLRCAAWQRLGGRGAGGADRHWASAAAVFGLVTAFVMLTYRLSVMGAQFFGNWRMDERVPPFPAQWWLAVAGWAVAVGFAFTRFGLVAAVGAWIAALSEVVVAFGEYASWPSHLVNVWWMLVLGVGGALALTLRAGARPQEALGVRRGIALAAAFTTLAVVPTLEALLAEVYRYPGGGYSLGAFGGYNAPFQLGGFPVTGSLTVVLGGVSTLVVLYCLVRAGASVRRRLIAMFVPALVLKLVVPVWFNGFLVSTQRFDPPVLLAAGQWVFLVAFPLVLFLLGALLVERAERHAHLIALGRAAERDARLTPQSTPS
ncbi:hypothetical protein Cme02nite_08890 [Catellatospora methionotrophica]|uniref:Uncharacterized protein n=1 Tax=Catellatospora methionotrophica TaxID=121620 RepID=A0A8J3PD04_9ACTN|nr:hypothetical protein [Catellatospora methionotrophica]GIG12557.1 hypothetical protein Cme02nite_08890 [Catellatospora methionotrophica]